MDKSTNKSGNIYSRLLIKHGRNEMEKKENTYTMNEQLKVGDKAITEIITFLKKKEFTRQVISVEDDRKYQKKDIDLIWDLTLNKKNKRLYIEVKGDTYWKSGNMFIETISNMSKNTPGCFLYTEADYIFYYFIETKELTMLPMKKFKEWFMANEERFQAKYLRTQYGNSTEYYRSKGVLVPKITLWNELNLKPIIVKK